MESRAHHPQRPRASTARWRAGVLPAAFSLLAAVSALTALPAQELTLGPELRIGRGFQPAVTADGSGRFHVAWTGVEGASVRIQTRQIDTRGRLRGGTRILSQGRGDGVSLAADAEGRLLAAWQLPQEGPQIDPAASAVFVRAFDERRRPLGEATSLEDDDARAEEAVEVARAPSGEGVVVWQSTAATGLDYRLWAQRLGAGGEPVAAPFRVRVGSRARVVEPAVTLADDGRFVVVWRDEFPGRAIVAQRYRADGRRRGGRVVIDGGTFASDVGLNGLAADGRSDGSLAIVWERAGAGLGDSEVMVASFDPRLHRTAGPLVANEPDGSVVLPDDVAVDAAGRMVVVWTASPSLSFSSAQVYLRAYDASGAPLSDALVVNESGGLHLLSSVATDDVGAFVVAWTDCAGSCEVRARRLVLP